METFVILLRHGIAEAKGSQPDATRELTDEGRKRMREIGRAISRLVREPGAIISSPLRRCVQTAELVVRAYESPPALTHDAALAPDAGAAALRDLIVATHAATMILVGHEPGLTTGMLALTGMTVRGEMSLKKGGCYGLRMGPGGEATLVWMLPPRVLRAVA